MNPQLILALLFYMVSVFYFISGIYMLKLNPHDGNNKILFSTMMTLTVWGFTFALSAHTNNLHIALLWDKISAMGWLFFYALVLLYTMNVSHYKPNLTRLKSVLLFVPPVLLLIFHSLGDLLSPPIQHAELTRFGYVIGSQNILWKIAFNSYYILYICTTLYLSYRWYYQIDDAKIKRQILAFTLAFTSSFALGFTLHTIIGELISDAVPPLGIFTILPSVIVMLYIMKRHHFMRDTTVDDQYENRVFISVKQKDNLYNLVAYLYLFGAIWGFGIAIFFIPVSQDLVVISSLYYLLTGCIILYLNTYCVYYTRKDRILNYLMALSIPFIILPYFRTFSVTVWSFTIIILFLGILFNDNHMIVNISISSILTLIVIAFIQPQGLAQINFDDHIVRIFVMVIATNIASYLRKTMVMRLTQLKANEAYQKAVFDVSQALLFTEIDDKKRRYQNALEKLRAYLNADCAFIYRFTDDGKTMILLSSTSEVQLPEKRTKHWVGDHNAIGIAEFNQLLVESDPGFGGVYADALYLPMKDRSELLGFIGLWTNQPTGFHLDDDSKFMSFSNIFSSAITKLETLEHMEYHARYDSLTGLANRSHSIELLDEALTKRLPLAVAFIDMDAFKMINDTKGHGFGDQLLCSVAKRLKAYSNPDTHVSRFGGDEFVIVFKHIDEQVSLSKRVEVLMQSLRQPFDVAGETVEMTFSCGVAVYPQDGHDHDTLLKHADMAMYEAKNSGKDRFVICHSALKTQITLA